MNNLYCSILSIQLTDLIEIIEDLFPDNTSSIIENGTVYLSDGDLFECSVEPSMHEGLYLSANYDGSILSFKKIVLELKGKIERIKGVYDIEYEIEKDGEFDSIVIRHPEYESRITPR